MSTPKDAAPSAPQEILPPAPKPAAKGKKPSEKTDEEVELESLQTAVIRHVNARIHLVVRHAAIGRHVAPPLRGVRAQQVVRAGRGRFVRGLLLTICPELTSLRAVYTKLVRTADAIYAVGHTISGVAMHFVAIEHSGDKFYTSWKHVSPGVTSFLVAGELATFEASEVLVELRDAARADENRRDARVA